MARKLEKAKFHVYGIGHFDVYENEIAKILEILFTDGDLTSFYEELEKERMG